jgi:hypothetical protein
MAQTTFSGPVTSDNGFSGGPTTTTNLTATGSVIILSGLPTSDPTVAGALWSNSGVVTVSAG